MQIKINLIVRLSISIFSFITAIIVFLSDNSIPYTQFLIPLTYSILILVIPQLTKYILKYVGVLGLNICMFLRYAVSPLLIAFDTTYLPTSTIPSLESYNLAVNLMLYEMVIIFILFALFSKNFYSEEQSNSLMFRYNLTGWGYLALCGVIVMIFPSLLARYSFVFTANQLERKDLNIDVLSILPLFLQLGSLILMISILNMLYKRYKNKEHGIYVVLSIISVIFISSFIVGTSRFSLILPLVSGLFIIYILYKKYRKLLTLFSLVAVILFVIITTLLKNRTISNASETVSNIFYDLSTDLQLYFSGITNVATSIRTSNMYEAFNFPSIFSDIFRSVVHINTYFESDISALEMFNIIFYNGGPARDQILPMIGQGYLYFGAIPSPIFTIITIFILMYLDKKTHESTNIFFKFVFIYGSLKIGLFMMTNFTNVISFLTNQIFILLLVFFVNELFHKRKRLYNEHR